MAVLAGGCPRADSPTATPGPRLRLDDDPASPSFGSVLLGPLATTADTASIERAVAAARDDLERAFAVWSGPAELAPTGCTVSVQQPPLLGRYRWQGRDLELEPRFPLVPGSTYTACADLGLLARVLAGHLRLDSGQTPRLQTTLAVPPAAIGRPDPPRVVSIWPEAPSVPENLLRLYVSFSEPMSRRDVASKVSLLGEGGEALHDAFVEIPNGLWECSRLA